MARKGGGLRAGNGAFRQSASAHEKVNKGTDLFRCNAGRLETKGRVSRRRWQRGVERERGRGKKTKRPTFPVGAVVPAVAAAAASLILGKERSGNARVGGTKVA